MLRGVCCCESGQLVSQPAVVVVVVVGRMDNEVKGGGNFGLTKDSGSGKGGKCRQKLVLTG